MRGPAMSPAMIDEIATAGLQTGWRLPAGAQLGSAAVAVGGLPGQHAPAAFQTGAAAELFYRG